MKITVSGMIGAGKSTVSDYLADKFHYIRYSSGGIMRKMASDRNMTLLDLSKIAERDSSIDREIDRIQTEIGKNEDNFVIDGRMSWYCIPNSLKIYLDVSAEEAARRIFNDKNAIRKIEKYSSVEELTQQILERKKSEIKRYSKYNIDIHDKTNYDVYLNTTNMEIKEVTDYLTEVIQRYIPY